MLTHNGRKKLEMFVFDSLVCSRVSACDRVVLERLLGFSLAFDVQHLMFLFVTMCVSVWWFFFIQLCEGTRY